MPVQVSHNIPDIALGTLARHACDVIIDFIQVNQYVSFITGGCSASLLFLFLFPILYFFLMRIVFKETDESNRLHRIRTS